MKLLKSGFIIKSKKYDKLHFQLAFLFFFFSILFFSVSLFPATAQNGITIQGMLADELDRPIADAKVMLSGPGFTQSILSLSDGKYSLIVPRLSSYTLTVKADGYRPFRQTVTLTKPEETIITTEPFHLVPTSLHIVLLDVKTKAPLGGGIVTVRSSSDDTTRRAIEGIRGEYYFGKLVSGIYDIAVSVTAYESRTIDRVVINDRNTLDQIILLARISSIPLGEKQKDRSITTPNLPSNQVLSIYPDVDGSLWFGTSKGLCHYDGRNFESSEQNDSLFASVAQLHINTILRTKNGSFWVGTDHGLFVQTKTDKILELIQPSITSSLEITSLYEDLQKNVWIGTSQGALCWSDSKITKWNKSNNFTDSKVNWLMKSKTDKQLLAATDEGLFRLENEWIKIPIKKSNGETLTRIQCIAEDNQGNIWLTTSTGLYQFNGNTVVFVSSPVLQVSLTRCTLDKFGYLWCIKQDGGVIVYDTVRQDTADLFSSDQVNTIATDFEEELWFGTESGAVRYDAFSFVTFNTSRGLIDSDVRAIANDVIHNRLWIGTAHGIQLFDGIQFRQSKLVKGNDSISSLLVSSDGALWIATVNGLFRWQESTGMSNELEVLSNENIKCLISDLRRPLLWIATETSIIPINQVTLKQEGEPVRINGEIRYLMQASSGLLWIATDHGVYRYDPTTAELVVIGTAQGLESLNVRWIHEQPTPGHFWFATGRGVENYDGFRFHSDSIKDATKGTDVRCLFTDRDGYLWIGFGDGNIRKFLLRVDGMSRVYKKEKYDLVDSSIRAITQGKDGTIWFATETGLIRHHPNRVSPSVEISLEVDGREITQASPIELNAGHHYIKFKFIGISLMGNVNYQYRISSKSNSSWKLFDGEHSNKNEVAVSDLPAGEHVFEVIAINRDLYGWNRSPVQFIVRIDRPVYAKTWFLILSGSLLLGSGGGLWLIQQRQKREYILPPHLKTFKPIDQNPFIVGNPIRQPNMFFGREDDFQYVKRKLEGTTQGLVIVLCGDRRTGKSSILYQIQNGRLGEKFIPVFIDLQEMVVQSDGEFFQRIGQLVIDAIKRKIKIEKQSNSDSSTSKILEDCFSLPIFSLENYLFTESKNNPFELFRTFIYEILRVLDHYQLLFLLDEYELLETKVENGILNKEIFPFFAGLIDGHDRLSMIFTGSKKLEQRDRRYWREMLHRSLFRKISYLSLGDAERLIVEPVRDRVIYGRNVVQSIYRLTAGQPFYTQVLCQNIVDYLNEQKRNYILSSDLESIVTDIVNNPLPQMIYFWEVLSDDEKIILSLLAETIVNGIDRVTASRLFQAIIENDYPVKLSENTIRLTLEELFRSEILLKDGDESFAYSIDLKRYWIKRSHSIWQVVREVKTL